MLKNKNKIILFVICLIIILIPIFYDNYEESYLEFNVPLRMGYLEKKSVADGLMENIEDYVSEVNDNEYPDLIINELYKNVSDAYLAVDLDSLTILESLIKERKEKVLTMNAFIDQTRKNVNRFENNARLNTSKYNSEIVNMDLLVIGKKYDRAYEIAIDIDTDLEFIVLGYIFNAEIIIQQLKEDNFTTIYVDDLLLASKETFSAAKTHELLIKVNNQTTGLKKDYSVGLIRNIENKTSRSDYIDYSLILKNTDEIFYKGKQIIETKNKIDLLKIKIGNHSNEDIDLSEVQKLLDESIIAFEEENFDKATSSVIGADTKLELQKASLTLTNIIAKESVGFLKRNWKIIVAVTLVISVSGYLFYRKERVGRLKRKLSDLKIEKEVLLEIIKETQRDKYINKKLSDSLYDIKMEKYEERLTAITEEIKTVTSVLKKFTKKRTKKKKVDGKIKKKKLKVQKNKKPKQKIKLPKNLVSNKGIKSPKEYNLKDREKLVKSKLLKIKNNKIKNKKKKIKRRNHKK